MVLPGRISRPATPMYTVRRGGSSVEIRYEGQVGSTVESFMDAMRHYPPLHHVVGRVRVYEAIWEAQLASPPIEVYTPEGRRIRVALPSRITLRPPRAASLAALGLALALRNHLQFIPQQVSKLFYAYGYVDRDAVCVEDCGGYGGWEYSEAPSSPSSRSVRSTIIYLDEAVLAEYHAMLSRGFRPNQLEPQHLVRQGRVQPLIPYFQPVLWFRRKSGFCIYPFEAYIYNTHPLLHEAATRYIREGGERKRYSACLERLAKEAGLRSPGRSSLLDILLPRRRQEYLVVATPPRFSPQYRTYLVGSRGRGQGRPVSLGSIRLEHRRVDARVAVVLEATRAYIRGRLVAPRILLDADRDVYFGDVFDTQALMLRVELPEGVGDALSRRILGDDELRSKLAYHVVYTAVRDTLRNRHDEDAQYVASRLWRVVRAYLIADRVLAAGLGADRRRAFTWMLMATLYGSPCISDRVESRIRNRLLPNDVKRGGLDALIACVSLRLAGELGVEVLGRGSSTVQRCLERSSQDEQVFEATLKAYRLLAGGWEPPASLVLGYAEAAVRHTLVHWLIAVETERMGLGPGDVEASEHSGSSVVYEMYEGGIGASRSAESLLSDTRETVRLLTDWVYALCIPMAVQYQLRSILSNPAAIARLWSRLHGGRRSAEETRRLLEAILGPEPQPSVVERVEEMTSSLEKLVEMLTLHAMIDYVRSLARLYPRPYELTALYSYTLLHSDTHNRLVDALAERVSRLLGEAGIGVERVRDAVSRSLRRIFEGRATLEELLETPMGDEAGDTCRRVSVRSAALAMEEYGGLWWLDGHPICHGVAGCGRAAEERDINESFAYLTPRLLEHLAGLQHATR